MASTLVERRLEVGLLRALGAERRRVAAFFLSEAAIVGGAAGLAGGVCGILLGRVLAGSVFGSTAPASWALLPFAVVLGIGVGILGSLAPVGARCRLKRPWS
jgi:ABC-type antimicrobial peptide transport system permease subunit